jgi:hypothetical protein
MKYTFGDAKKILANATHSTMVDIGDKINNAVQALCGLNPWEHEFLRQVIRIKTVTPEISLPQWATGLVRACVNGRPTTLHGQDFQFLSSGPGDLSKVPTGFNALADDILDLGTGPVWRQPKGTAWLCAASRSETQQPDITINAVGISGDRIEFKLTPQSEGNQLVYDQDHPVSRIEDVVLGDNSTAYISLYKTEVLPADPGKEMCIGRFHPSVKVPQFRSYRLPLNELRYKRPYEILAEVQCETLPLIDDTDVIPFPSLEPIKAMILYEYTSQNLESQAADTYLKQAASWITRFNTARNTRQGPTLLNIPYEGSMGQLSDFYENL